jgi:hypothetical protein
MGLLNRLFPRSGQVELLIVKLSQLQTRLSRVQEALGRVEARQLRLQDEERLQGNEFRVFSQWGEDGIIQFLIARLNIRNRIFVEFGVENYLESNTRFLLIYNGWSGLVMDGNEENIRYIRDDPIYWQYNLKAAHAFVTAENINSLLDKNGMRGEIGLLSIDIDGNDYWVWKALQIVQPALVVIEYNFRFGKDRAVTIPYTKHFIRQEAHFSGVYYGASLKALYLLALKKGYAFVGCNSAGNNAFFVRRDLKPEEIPEVTVEEGYVAGQFRESRDQRGELAYLSPEEEKEILASLPLVDVEREESLNQDL